jgi:hypothetical protein
MKSESRGIQCPARSAGVSNADIGTAGLHRLNVYLAGKGDNASDNVIRNVKGSSTENQQCMHFVSMAQSTASYNDMKLCGNAGTKAYGSVTGVAPSLFGNRFAGLTLASGGWWLKTVP